MRTLKLLSHGHGATPNTLVCQKLKLLQRILLAKNFEHHCLAYGSGVPHSTVMYFEHKAMSGLWEVGSRRLLFIRVLVPSPPPGKLSVGNTRMGVGKINGFFRPGEAESFQ